MTQNEYKSLLTKLHAAKVAAEKAKALTDELKAAMAADGISTVQAGGFIANVKSVSSKTLDSKALERDYPELVAQYKRESVTSRLYLK